MAEDKLMIRIELSPEMEARLAAEAQARGIEVQTYIENLIERAFSAQAENGRFQPTSEQMQAFFQVMAANSDKIPQLPDEAFERESFYQDHD